MTRLRPQSVGKAESLFVANLKPFSTASVKRRRTHIEQMSSALHPKGPHPPRKSQIGQNPQVVLTLSVNGSISKSLNKLRPNKPSHFSCAAYASASRAAGHSYF